MTSNQSASQGYEAIPFAQQILEISKAAANSKFNTPRDSLLDVEILGREAEAYLTSDVLQSVVNAGGYFAKAISEPSSGEVRLNPQFRQKLGVRHLALQGNSFTLGFPPRVDNAQTPLIDESTIPTLAERSFENLTDALPKDVNDELALSSALGMLPPERKGLHQLSETLNKHKVSVALKLATPERDYQGVLTHGQAGILVDSLNESKDITWKQSISGRLDGMRTRRRQFFFETSQGVDIVGAIADDLLSSLPAFINKPVVGEFVCRQPIYATGKKGKIAYRLTDINMTVALG